jgi:RNA polymerase sigma-70 factor (ECF subfamily)
VREHELHEAGEDDRLIERVAAGDRAALEALVRRHQAAVHRLARSLTSSEQAAEDVLQETFVTVLRRAETYRGEGSVRSWLLTVARRAAARHRRVRAGEPKAAEIVPLDALGLAAGWGDDSPEMAAAAAEERGALRQALERLAEDDRSIIVLRDLEGLSGAEAADVLGLTPGAAKVRLHRARLKLMASLEKGGFHGD